MLPLCGWGDPGGQGPGWVILAPRHVGRGLQKWVESSVSSSEISALGTELSRLCVGSLGKLTHLHRRAVGRGQVSQQTHWSWACSEPVQGGHCWRLGPGVLCLCDTKAMYHAWSVPGLLGGCRKGGGSNRGHVCACVALCLSLVSGPVTHRAGPKRGGLWGGGSLHLLLDCSSTREYRYSLWARKRGERQGGE